MKPMICCFVCIVLVSMLALSLGCGCSNLREGMEASVKWKMQSVQNQWSNVLPPSSSFPAYPVSSNHLDMLGANVSSPNCRSELSNDTGQLCMTPEQLKFIQFRGGNRAPMNATCGELPGSDF
jgi:hypothetical protein